MPPQKSSSGTKQVEQKAGQMVDQAEQQADQVANKAKQQAMSQAESRKNQAAQELSAVADAVRQAGQHLRQQQHGTVAHYADMAAERVDGFSQSLQQRDVNQMIGEAGQLAKKRPGLFVGGAFAVGLLGARFLKSSSMPESGGTSGQAMREQRRGYPVEPHVPPVETVDYVPARPATYSPYAPDTEG